MDIFFFRETNGFTAKPLDPRAQSQVISFDLLCILFPRNQMFSRDSFLIGKVIVRINCSDRKRLQQLEQFIQILVFSCAERKRQRSIGGMIYRPP